MPCKRKFKDLENATKLGNKNVKVKGIPHPKIKKKFL